MNDLMMTVVGNVIRDVDLRFTGSGDPVASFRVASNTRRFDRDSERSEDGQVQRVLAAWRSFVFAYLDDEGQPHEEAPPSSSSAASSSDSSE